jgi:hypothetical protein
MGQRRRRRRARRQLLSGGPTRLARLSKQPGEFVVEIGKIEGEDGADQVDGVCHVIASRAGVLGPRKMPTPVIPMTLPVAAHAQLATSVRSCVPSLNDPDAGCAATATAIIPDGVFSTPICRTRYLPAGEGLQPPLNRLSGMTPSPQRWSFSTWPISVEITSSSTPALATHTRC